MELNSDTYNLYAAKHYDNVYCFSQKEFIKDLNTVSTIRRMVSWIMNGDDINTSLLVNNVISFYNVFEHHAATELIGFKSTEEQALKINSILLFLSYPLIGEGEYDLVFHRRIAQAYRQ